ncbi:MAG TPA: sigma-70 family RNA polymerase sigma factor [Solirubrobacteraceae bacterium]|nr:sigma-70 family RNA polymerase sigma factor [Solirubrobacteraceae bacterium]
MTPSDSKQMRSRPWWRSSQRTDLGRGSAQSAEGPRGRDADELALVCRAKRGGPREREELVRAYLPMIASVARAYRRSTAVGRDELTQEGVVGLLCALERYDPDRGVPFWGYAAWWVRRSMQQVVSELSRPIVLSDRALRQLARIKKAQRSLEQGSRREVTSAELAAIVGLPRAEVENLLRTERTARGLDEPAGSEAVDGTSVGELLADPPAQEAYERVPEQLLAAEVPGLLGRLTDRERTVICSRYGLGRPEQTLREIAPKLGVSAERVRQIEQGSLAKLHDAAALPRPRRGQRNAARTPTSYANA